MKLRPGPYRDVADNTEIIQMAEITARDDLIKLTTQLRHPGVLLFIFTIAILATVWNYVGNTNEALAAENEWRPLANETPEPDRNLWVYWEEGECARLVQWDELGFHTALNEPIKAKWWLKAIGDEPPPVRYCTYE